MHPPPLDDNFEQGSTPTLGGEVEQETRLDEKDALPAVPQGLTVSRVKGEPYFLLAFAKEPAHPDDPLCFPVRKKARLTVLASLLVMLSAMVSSCSSGAAPYIQADLGGNSALPLSMFIFGYVAGPFVWSPLSEAYGRRPFFLIHGIFFSLFTGVCAAAPTYGALLVLRFISGFFGAVAMTNSGALCGDIYSPAKRGTAMAYYSVATFSGPALGPIIASFAAERQGWPWAFTIPAILSSATFVALSFGCPETYPPVLVSRVAKRLRAEKGGEFEMVFSALELAEMRSRELPRRERYAKEAWRLLGTPLVMIATEPIVTLCAAFMAAVYGLIYLLFEAYPIIFSEIHHLGPGYSSLPFLGTFVGAVFSVPVNLWFQKRYLAEVKHAGKHLPEMRLPPAATGGPLIVVAFLWLGWGGYKLSVHWIVPVLSGLPQGIGSVLTFRAIQTYTIDAYGHYSASALAAAVVSRSVAGAVFPLFAPALFHAIGTQWACTLLAGVMLLLCPVPFLFQRYGARLRKNSRFAPDK
ncbi:hypothetical protein JCM8547_007886 [Rhodosporidiobolus lusitaniae]